MALCNGKNSSSVHHPHRGEALPPCYGPPYICSQQFLGIVNAGHQDFTLADERVVIRVGCNQQQL